MKVYVNERNEIHEVNTCSDPSLIELEVTDGAFDGWTDAKICCYKVNVKDGNVTMMTPYVDSRLIEHIDQLGRQVEEVTPITFTAKGYIDDTYVIFEDVPEGQMTVTFENLITDYKVERDEKRVTIYFEPLEEVTNITLNIH